VQAEVGVGTATVRPPRLELADGELAAARALIRDCLRRRPAL